MVEFFYGPRIASEGEMRAFGTIYQAAEHGASFSEHWEALGYSCPKSNLVGSFFQTQNSKKAKVLYEILIDCIIATGLKCIGSRSSSIYEYLKMRKQTLKNNDIQFSLIRLKSSSYEYNICSQRFMVAERLSEQNLPVNDADKLENVFKMIQFSYSEVFSELFKGYKAEGH